MTPVVDAHAHWYSEEILAELTRHNPGSTLRMVSAVRLSVGRTRRSVQRSSRPNDQDSPGTRTRETSGPPRTQYVTVADHEGSDLVRSG